LWDDSFEGGICVYAISNSGFWEFDGFDDISNRKSELEMSEDDIFEERCGMEDCLCLGLICSKSRKIGLTGGIT